MSFRRIAYVAVPASYLMVDETKMKSLNSIPLFPMIILTADFELVKVIVNIVSNLARHYLNLVLVTGFA